MFERIGIFGKYEGIQSWESIDKLIPYFQKNKRTVYLDEQSCKDFPNERHQVEIVQRNELVKKIDLAVVIGGDGTFLDVARSVVNHGVPILGINLGRLGFLTDVSPDSMLSTFDEVLQGDYACEARNLLKVTIKDGDEVVFQQTAFNDVVIHKTDSPRMIEFETFVDGRFLNSQRSDGMIVSTPTGSTAYSLSAGGPIIMPEIDAMTMVSINPHTMSARPFVVSGSSTIEIVPHENCGGTANIICDGQVTHIIRPGLRTFITHNDTFIKMIHPKGHDHFELLRAKLHWGDKL